MEAFLSPLEEEGKLPTEGQDSSEQGTQPSIQPIPPIDSVHPELTRVTTECPEFKKVLEFLDEALGGLFEEEKEKVRQIEAERDLQEQEYFKNRALLQELDAIASNLEIANGPYSHKAKILGDKLELQRCKQIAMLKEPTLPVSGGGNNKQALKCLDENRVDVASSQVLGIRKKDLPTDECSNSTFQELIPFIENNIAQKTSKLENYISVFRNSDEDDDQLKGQQEPLAHVSRIPVAKALPSKDEDEIDLMAYLESGGPQKGKKGKRRGQKKAGAAATTKITTRAPVATMTENRCSLNLDTKKPSNSKEARIAKKDDVDVVQAVERSLKAKQQIEASIVEQERRNANLRLQLINSVNEAMCITGGFAEDFIVGQAKLSKKEIEHKLLRTQCLEDKVRSLNVEFMGRTYKREKVVALREIRRHVNSKLVETTAMVKQLQKEVDEYQSLDVGFGDMVKEYASIQEKIQNVQHHLKQFEE
eukprot:jgi/Bigna1/90860/estExt_fgenesh1_pg.C_810059